MAVVAPPPQILGFLGCGIIGVLDRDSVRNGISGYEGELGVLLLVHVRLGGKDDGGVIFELDTRTFWVLKVAVGWGG